MSNSMKIFQLYYKPEQEQLLDPVFIPYDNTENLRPDLREWHIWNKEYVNCLRDDLKLWGFVSWKFAEKTGLDGQQFVDFIAANPGYDVYFVNPCLINEAVFINSWEQGDIHHPNISDIGNTFFKKLGYENLNVKEVVLDRNITMFANYIVGNRKFWDDFIDFSNKLFIEADKDPEFHQMVFGEGLSNYSGDPSLCNFTFLIERLIPTFIEVKQLKSIPFGYTPETLPEKYVPYADDLASLSNLKVLINRYESDDLYAIWNHYRHKFLRDNPGILGLE